MRVRACVRVCVCVCMFVTDISFSVPAFSVEQQNVPVRCQPSAGRKLLMSTESLSVIRLREFLFSSHDSNSRSHTCLSIGNHLTST